MEESASSVLPDPDIELLKLKEASMTSLIESPSGSPTDSSIETDVQNPSDKPTKPLLGSHPTSKLTFKRDDGGLLIDIYVRQSYADGRKTIILQVLIACHGSIPPLDPGGGWIQREIFLHVVDPDQLKGLEIWIEAEILLWSPMDSSLVYSNSRNWPDMKIMSGTHKVLRITAAQLLSGEVVSGKWCGTTADHDLLDYLQIPGALEIKEIYEDEVADGGRKDFKLIATPSYPDNNQQHIIAFANRDMLVQHAA